MSERLARLGLALLVALLAACQPVPPGPPPAHLTQAEWWASPARGWEPPASLAEAGDGVLAAGTPWQPVALPHARPREVARADGGQAPPEVAWYRLHVPAAPLAATPQGPRLYLPRWQTIGTLAVYVDGRLAWRSRGSRTWNSFNRPVWIDLAGLAAPGQPLTVHVRMASQPGVGGALSSLWAGSAEALTPGWRARSLLQADLVAFSRGSYLLLGVCALALWLPRRRQRGEAVFLLFFLMSLCHLLATLQYLVDTEGFGLADDWFSWLTLAGSLGSALCAFHVLCLVQRRARPRTGRVLAAYVGAVALLTLPLWSLPHAGMLPLLRLTLLPPSLVVLAVALGGAWRQRDWASGLLAGWMALSIPVGLHDLALQSYRLSIEHIYLTPYLYVGVFTLFLLIAFTRYNRALSTAERANATLGERLAAQARDLAETHQRLRAAEHEQTLMAERQRMTREMHDGVGSSLMSALRLVEGGQGGQVNVAQVLQECIDDLKLSIDSLEPVDADLLALLASLRFRLGPRLEGAGLALHWRVQELPPLPWLDPQSALHVLRILQEVLTNIVKHSGAREITVATGEARGPGGAPGVRVDVADDGRPFTLPPPQARQLGRKGLGNVQARALALGAQVRWQPQPGRGTRFTLWLPLGDLAGVTLPPSEL